MATSAQVPAVKYQPTHPSGQLQTNPDDSSVWAAVILIRRLDRGPSLFETTNYETADAPNFWNGRETSRICDGR
jgi:hypothetical protein